MTTRWTIAAQATRGSALAVLLVVACHGCRSRPEPVPFRAASASASVCYYGGSPLGGHTAPDPSALQRDQAQAVRASLFALRHEPEAGLPLLADQMRLLSSALEGEAVRPTAGLLAGVRFAEGDASTLFGAGLLDGQFGPEARLADLTAALPPGVTAVIQVDSPGDTGPAADPEIAAIRAPDPVLPPPHLSRLEIHLHRAGKDELRGRSPYSLALWVRHGASRASSGVQEEGVLLDLELELDQPLALVFPPGASPLPDQVLAVFVHVEARPAEPDSAFNKAFQGCARAFAASADRPPKPPAPPQDLATAVAALERPMHRRQALEFLARQTGASLTGEAASLLDDRLVEALARHVREDLSAPDVPVKWTAARTPTDRRRLGWQIEQATAEVLSEALEERTPSVELEGLLCRFAGEAGRHAGSLAAVFLDAESEAELQELLVEVNSVYLDDPSPAVRVRAFDWLARRNRAPDGFDPLAPRDLRRAALRQAEAAKEAEADRTASPARKNGSTPEPGSSPGGGGSR